MLLAPHSSSVYMITQSKDENCYSSESNNKKNANRKLLGWKKTPKQIFSSHYGISDRPQTRYPGPVPRRHGPLRREAWAGLRVPHRPGLGWWSIHRLASWLWMRFLLPYVSSLYTGYELSLWREAEVGFRSPPLSGGQTLSKLYQVLAHKIGRRISIPGVLTS